MCGERNSAVYGACIASTYKGLRVVPQASPVYPGVPFPVTVLKTDAYNQTVLTDSSSVLQVYAVGADAQGAGAPGESERLAILGPTIVRMQRGAAEFHIAVKPAFALVSAAARATRLAHPPAVFFTGSDAGPPGASAATVQMQSPAFTLSTRGGPDVCPPGHVLALDPPAAAGAARLGACAACAEGTYAVSPLVGGSDAASPACVACPLQALQAGDCAAAGASAINFSLGTWAASDSDGVYRLVGCPAGFQLVNAVDGAFSNQIQRCARCGASQYVIDPNSPNYTCQDCPAFLNCSGAAPRGRYPGAQWAVDPRAGAYVLTGCPAGYAMDVPRQDCVLCPPLYYCPGGGSPRLQCPASTFCPAGAKASGDCAPSVLVGLQVTLPLALQDFHAAAQRRFVGAAAAAARVARRRRDQSRWRSRTSRRRLLR